MSEPHLSVTPISRILAMDGAGIYGLTAGLWLEQMALRDPRFLEAGQVDLFAGISSGAVNSLLLARQASPRDGIRDTIRTWQDPAPWRAPANPWDWWLSNLGMSSWYGHTAWRAYLERLFGQTRLGDLDNRVLLCCYDLSGSTRLVEALHADTIFEKVFAMARAAMQPNNGDPSRHWEPVLISNFLPDHQDWADFKLSDLAYAVTAMPSMREVRGGLGDGGIYNANPSTMAIIAALQLQNGGDPASTGAFELMGTGLAKMLLLSIGDGSVQPYLADPTFNWGWVQWMMHPANVHQGIWSPYAYNLEPGEQMNDVVAQTLLGRAKYCRLNPPVLMTPCAVTCYAARVPLWRQLIIDEVKQGVLKPASVAAVTAALAFVGGTPWRDGIDPLEPLVPPGDQPAPPQPPAGGSA